MSTYICKNMRVKLWKTYLRMMVFEKQYLPFIMFLPVPHLLKDDVIEKQEASKTSASRSLIPMLLEEKMLMCEDHLSLKLNQYKNVYIAWLLSPLYKIWLVMQLTQCLIPCALQGIPVFTLLSFTSSHSYKQKSQMNNRAWQLTKGIFMFWDTARVGRNWPVSHQLNLCVTVSQWSILLEYKYTYYFK